MTINTEWLWTPYDGHVDGSKFNKGDMSKAAYSEELSFYTNIIRQAKVDLVALSEIENSFVAKDIANRLGGKWRSYFKQGRDTATGQDVAMVTRLDVISDSVTDFGFPCAKPVGLKKKKCLSKVLGLTVRIKTTSEPLLLSIITSHFLSKRNSTKIKNLKREAQAIALTKALSLARNEYGDKAIVLGDFNDTVKSKVLKRLVGLGHLRNSLECSESTGRENKRRVDHILFSGLECIKHKVFDLKSHSDHPAVFSSFRY